MTVGAGADTGGVSESVSGSLRVKDRSGTGGSKSLGVGKEKEKDQDEAEEIHVAPGSSEEERLEQLYETIAWPLGQKYGHPYDAFKLALTCVAPFSVPEAPHLT